MADLIERQTVLSLPRNKEFSLSGELINQSIDVKRIEELPSAQPEITDVQAIEHLQDTGWMQNHDHVIYESGLRDGLADDSGSYDSLIPAERNMVDDLISFIEREEDKENRTLADWTVQWILESIIGGKCKITESATDHEKKKMYVEFSFYQEEQDADGT